MYGTTLPFSTNYITPIREEDRDRLQHILASLKFHENNDCYYTRKTSMPRLHRPVN